VLELARLSGIAVEEGYFSPDDLAEAKEIFLTNTTYEIMPVTLLGQCKVGDGRPGEITRFLLQKYREKIPQFLAEDESNLVRPAET